MDGIATNQFMGFGLRWMVVPVSSPVSDAAGVPGGRLEGDAARTCSPGNAGAEGDADGAGS